MAQKSSFGQHVPTTPPRGSGSPPPDRRSDLHYDARSDHRPPQPEQDAHLPVPRRRRAAGAGARPPAHIRLTAARARRGRSHDHGNARAQHDHDDADAGLYGSDEESRSEQEADPEE